MTAAPNNTPNFLEHLLEKQTAILKALEAKFDLQLQAEQKCPGIEEVVASHLNSILNGYDIPKGLKEPYTVRDYVFHKHRKHLSFSHCVSLGSFASGYFTGINLKLPKRSSDGYRTYTYADLPAWDAAYHGWLNRRFS